MVTIGGSTYTLLKDGSGRFSVFKDGQRAGELLGRPGAWGAYDMKSTRLGSGASHGDAIKVLAERTSATKH